MKMEKYRAEWKSYNRLMKKLGAKQRSLEDYFSMRKGKGKPVLRGTALPNYDVSDHRIRYPSGEGIGTAAARVEKKYTGTLVKGIMVTHKSNLVPITSREQAIDISNMRRNHSE